MDKENTEKYLIETVQSKDIQEINMHYDRQLKKKKTIDFGTDSNNEITSTGFNKIEMYLSQLLDLNEKSNQQKHSSLKPVK